QVSGTGSLWKNSASLYVGNSGSFNRLTIQSGGAVSNTTGYIGRYASGSNNTAEVSGANSLWNNSASLYVGYASSNNQLTLTDNGTAKATNAVVGFSAGVTGNQITVSGGNLLVTNSTGGGALDILRGTLTLNSGTVTVNRLYATNGASSVVAFNGGTLNTAGSIVSNGVSFTVGDGTSPATFNLLGGTHRFADGFSVSSNATLMGAGTIQGDMTLAGGISPGSSPGIIGIQGNLTLTNSALLEMELAGTLDSEYDQLQITAKLTASGELKVTFINGFTPQDGDTFDLLDYGSVAGSFQTLNLPSIGLWDTSHLLADPSDPQAGSLIWFVPEPSAGTLLGLGFAALVTRRLRRK
ncbi:MAG: PEP-CTERM sorting domain-containing protein, partial [Verrucomicrobia bacterium]|nr:PEP-CTERM sorting domain-containing protein [Verrucomicrobiota bacterium]